MQKSFFLNLLRYDWWISNLVRLIYVVFVIGYMLPLFSEQGSSINKFFRDSFFLFLISVFMLAFIVSQMYNKKKNKEVGFVLLARESKPFSWLTSLLFLSLIVVMVILYFQSQQYSQVFLLGGILFSLELIEEIRNRFRKEDKLLCSSEQFIRLPSNRNRVIKKERVNEIKLMDKRLVFVTDFMDFKINNVNISDEEVAQFREIILSQKKS